MRKFRINKFYSSVTLLIISSILVVPVLSLPLVIDPSVQTSNGSGDTYMYSPDGKGYLKTNTDGKKLMHVEGSAYEMGYQHGYLLAEGVQYMSSTEYLCSLMMDFAIDMTVSGVKEMVLEPLIALFGWLIDPEVLEAFVDDTSDFMLETGRKLFMMPIIEHNLKYVPEEFIEEMQGVADGATDAGYPTDLENLLLLNMGMDAAVGIIYPFLAIVESIPGIPLFIKRLFENFHACNGFVVYGDATTDGRVIMGRDFQFSGYGFSETTLMIEQFPDEGYNFVTCSAPGFVGLGTGMNSRGIGMGAQMLTALDLSLDYGMGLFFTIRNVIQYAGELSEAIDMVRNSKRGNPWIYSIGDGIGPEIGGVMLETTARNFFARGCDYDQPWWAPFSQVEAKDDIVTGANHFINPWMNLKTISWAYNNTLWRYETMTNLILDNYGTIDMNKGWDIIDFLHPPNYDYYGDDPHQTVKAAKSLMDLTNLDMYSLYGYYDDPLIVHSLN